MQQSQFTQEGESLYNLHYPGRGEQQPLAPDHLWRLLEIGLRHYLMVRQLLLGLLGRPRLSHKEVTIVNAQIAGLVQFRPVRTSLLSGPFFLAKYDSTNTFLGRRHIS